MRPLLVVALLACGGPRSGADAAPPDSAPADAAPPRPAWLDEIRAPDLLADIAWLSSAELAGRGSRAPGAASAAGRIAAAFAAAGLQTTRQPLEQGQLNVVGVRLGAEPAILLLAHHDHLGVEDGVVYPGADDNASGTAALLALARALGRRPGRKVVFLSTAMEEVGLLGAHAYARSPVVPLDRTDAAINLDMVGRRFLGQPSGRTVGLVGAECGPRFERALVRALAAEGVDRFAVSARLFETVGFGARSDDWVLRERGVCAVLVSGGVHQDYHRPSDRLEAIVPEQIEAVTRAVARAVDELSR